MITEDDVMQVGAVFDHPTKGHRIIISRTKYSPEAQAVVVYYKYDLGDTDFVGGPARSFADNLTRSQWRYSNRHMRVPEGL